MKVKADWKSFTAYKLNLEDEGFSIFFYTLGPQESMTRKIKIIAMKYGANDSVAWSSTSRIENIISKKRSDNERLFPSINLPIQLKEIKFGNEGMKGIPEFVIKEVFRDPRFFWNEI